jgi:hypothetical protein
MLLAALAFPRAVTLPLKMSIAGSLSPFLFAASTAVMRNFSFPPVLTATFFWPVCCEGCTKVKQIGSRGKDESRC